MGRIDTESIDRKTFNRMKNVCLLVCDWKKIPNCYKLNSIQCHIGFLPFLWTQQQWDCRFV